MTVGEETNGCERWVDVRELFSLSFLKVRAVSFFFCGERENSKPSNADNKSTSMAPGRSFGLCH